MVRMRHKSFHIGMYACLLVILTMSALAGVEALTWSVNTKQLTNHPYYDSFPALMQTEEGRVWLVWSRAIQGNFKLHYKITSDQGKSWSEAMNLTDKSTPGHDQNPSIMQAQNSTIWVVWTSDRPPPPPPPTPDFDLDASPQNLTIPQGESENSTIIVTSLNSFSEPVDLSVFDEPTGVTATLHPTQVTPPANGTAYSNLTISVGPSATPGNYTVMVMGKGDHLMHSVDVDLEIPIAGSTSESSAPIHMPISSSTTDSSSTEDYEIYYKTTHDNGETWGPDMQLTNNGVDDLCPAIIQLTNGTTMIVWQSYVSGSHNICYRTTPDGVSWSETTQLTTDAAHDKAPAAIQANDGDIWVVWSSMRTGDWEVFYKIYDGFAWSNDRRLSNHTDSDLQPAIVQAADGELFVFWASQKVLDDFDIYYKCTADGGSTWSERVTFVAGGYEDMWPAATRALDTKIWVAWANDEVDQPDSNWEIFCRTSLAGDVNQDGQVNVVDLTMVSLAYGTLEGEPGYNPDADLNNDGIVDMRDLRIVAYYLGET